MRICVPVINLASLSEVARLVEFAGASICVHNVVQSQQSFGYLGLVPLRRTLSNVGAVYGVAA